MPEPESPEDIRKYIDRPKTERDYITNHLGNRYNRKCKICNSPYAADITTDLINTVPYKEIREKYPDLNLSDPNIANHQNHMGIIPRGVELYVDALDTGAIKVVNEIEALDNTYSKCFEYIRKVDFDKAAPRKIEVVGELMLKAIRLKADLLGQGQNPGEALADLFKKALSQDRVGEVDDSR